MIGRGVERIETMPLRFNVGTVGEREPHSPKNPDGAVEHLRERMESAAFARRAGQRNVDAGQRARFLRGPKFLNALRDRRRHRGPHFVQQFSDNRSLFLPERFHLFAPGGNASAASEIANADSVERRFVVHFRNFAQRGVAQFFEWVRHSERNVQRPTLNVQR